MFIQKKHKVARAARGNSGNETFFSAPVFWKNEGGGSLPPASKWCLPPPPMPEGSLYTAAHTFLPPINDSHHPHPHSAHPSGLSVSALPRDIPIDRTDKARHCHDTFPEFPALLQSIGHSPVIPRGKSEAAVLDTTLQATTQLPAPRREKLNYYLLSQRMSKAIHAPHFQDVCFDITLSLP